MGTRVVVAALAAGLMFGMVACTTDAGSAPTASPATLQQAVPTTIPIGLRTSSAVAPPASPTQALTTGTPAQPTRAPVTTRSSQVPTTLTTASVLRTTATTDWAGAIYPCGWAVTPDYPTEPTATPAPNACNDIAMMTPACHDPNLIVSDGATRALTTWNPPTGGPDTGLVYDGADGYICIDEYPDRFVEMSHGDGGIVVQPNDNPIAYAARIGLQRSSGIWGIARRDVTAIEIVDAARPHGVLANLMLARGWDTQIFIAPVSSSRVIITAIDAAGRQLDRTTVPPCC